MTGEEIFVIVGCIIFGGMGVFMGLAAAKLFYRE